MRRPLIAGLGILAILVGGLWIGQGAGAIGGSFMTGDRTWLVIGILVALAGAGVLGVGLRGRRRPRL